MDNSRPRVCGCPGLPIQNMNNGIVNHPRHYTQHPSGVECIQITEHFNFNIGNGIKYLWRSGLKTNDPIIDLKKAVWYIEREIERLEAQQCNQSK